MNKTTSHSLSVPKTDFLILVSELHPLVIQISNLNIFSSSVDFIASLIIACCGSKPKLPNFPRCTTSYFGSKDSVYTTVQCTIPNRASPYALKELSLVALYSVFIPKLPVDSHSPCCSNLQVSQNFVLKQNCLSVYTW